MARPRTFDVDDAIARAMEVFWINGYEDASLPELLDGMKLTRGSLYKAFKDKKTLFLKVLDRYDAEAVNNAVALLSDTQISDGWDRIDLLFDSIAQDVSRGDSRGCLLCSAAAGPASYDPEIAAAVNLSLDRMQAAFDTALAATESPPRLGVVLVTQYVGLRILSRSELSAHLVETSVEQLRQLRNLG
ncbi:MAG: TetR/AcrR family transcriptional regulator [Litoreibacter sp.]